MHIPFLTLPRLAWHQQRQPACNQAFQLMHHLLGIFKVMHAPAACQQFVDRLRPAQKQQPAENHLGRYQLQGFIHPMLPAVGAAAHDQAGKAATFQGAPALAHLALAAVPARIATGFLVAGDHQCVEGQRVGFGAGGLFLDQAAQDADFRAVQARFFLGGVVLGGHRAFPNAVSSLA